MQGEYAQLKMIYDEFRCKIDFSFHANFGSGATCPSTEAECSLQHFSSLLMSSFVISGKGKKQNIKKNSLDAYILTNVPLPA